MKHNEDTREHLINNEYWMQQSDIETLDKVRDLLYCKYAIREELENRNCIVDMKGIEHWAKKFESIRKEINL